jgi:hypothetical protein
MRACPSLVAWCLLLTVAAPLDGQQADAVRVVVSNPNLPGNRAMPGGAGRLTGHTRDARTGAPVPGAIVALALPGFGGVRVMTDAQGRFEFSSLPAGRFSITATLNGYADGAQGRLRPSGPAQPVDLPDGQRLNDLTITLWPFGVVAGTVVDAAGEPVIGLTVHAYRRTISGGRWRLAPGPTDATDDRGMFRISGLEPGAYLVGLPMTTVAWPASLERHMIQGGEWPPDLTGMLPKSALALIGQGVQPTPNSPIAMQTVDRVPPAAIGPDGHVEAYLAQFFPNATSASDAGVITLGAGEERPGVDFVLRSERALNVSGVVHGPMGSVDNLVLTLSPAAAIDRAMPLDAAVAITDDAGRFTFTGVAPGQYVMRALRMPRTERVTETRVMLTGAFPPAPPQPELPKDAVQWLEQSVTVDATDVSGLAVTLRTGARVRGRLQFSGAPRAPDAAALSRIRLTLDPADARTASLVTPIVRGRVESDGQFASVGAPAGRYVITASGLPDGWSLESAMLGGRDISSDAFDLGAADVVGVTIALTDRPASMGGAVTSASGASDSAATVLVFPTDPLLWTGSGADPRRLRSARTDARGQFLLSGLPPGSYFAVAIPEAMAGDWSDPAVLQGFARTATRIDLGPHESRQVALQTVRPSVR